MFLTSSTATSGVKGSLDSASLSKNVQANHRLDVDLMDSVPPACYAENCPSCLVCR